MSITTVRADGDRKRHVNQATKRAGKTVHVFVVAAIAAKVAEGEEAAEPERIADERWGRLHETGKPVARKFAR